MYYYLYKLTDPKNGKYYFGVHKTCNLDDGYKGSGVRLNKTIKDRCTKEILEFFDTEDQMFDREREIVNEAVVVDPNSYNMCVGGCGGDTLTYHPQSREIIEKIKATKAEWSDEKRERINSSKINRGQNNGMYGTSRTKEANPMFNKTHSDETKRLIGEKAKQRYKDGWRPHNTGVPASDEQKQKLREANSRTFIFLKDGNNVIIHNLAEYCRINNLNELCMRHVAAGRNKQHKGYYRGTV